MLKKYQSAYCVVTTRLHCALPCLALGTPVLMIKEEISRKRIETYYNFFDTCTFDELLGGMKSDFFASPTIPSAYWQIYRDELRGLCKNFIHNTTIYTPILPEYSDIIQINLLKCKALECIAQECSNTMLEFMKNSEEKTLYILGLEERIRYLEEQQKKYKNQLYQMPCKLTKFVRKIMDKIHNC
jgi:hypothetical protein